MARRSIVLAAGVFDLIHLGHVRFLVESKKRGGPRAQLVVVVARDKTVLGSKGRKPIFPEAQRRDLVASLRVVDRAILGHKQFDMRGILRKVKPDVICVGYDQREIEASVKKLINGEGLHIPVVRITKFGPRGLDSSSRIKERIAKRRVNAG